MVRHKHIMPEVLLIVLAALLVTFPGGGEGHPQPITGHTIAQPPQNIQETTGIVAYQTTYIAYVKTADNHLIEIHKKGNIRPGTTVKLTYDQAAKNKIALTWEVL
jgi:hypothetical protein